MINPGVIKLVKNDSKYRFEIEDNLGESIHIHYMDIRLDFTIKEFLEFAGEIEAILTALVSERGLSPSDFDAAFFSDIAAKIPDLEKVTEDSVMLEELLIDTYDEHGNLIMRPLHQSRVFKALNGDTSENEARRQRSDFAPKRASRITNKERLNLNFERIKRSGGFAENDYITLFNGSNLIRDGQHRAACAYHLYGNVPVRVKRLWFCGGAHDVGSGGEDGEMISRKRFESELRRAQAYISELQNSTSWKLTKPVRALGRLLKRGR